MLGKQRRAYIMTHKTIAMLCCHAANTPVSVRKRQARAGDSEREQDTEMEQVRRKTGASAQRSCLHAEHKYRTSSLSVNDAIWGGAHPAITSWL
jgi:Ser-tRNA(Ala) deacylase AlaX